MSIIIPAIAIPILALVTIFAFMPMYLELKTFEKSVDVMEENRKMIDEIQSEKLDKIIENQKIIKERLTKIEDVTSFWQEYIGGMHN
jgi:hypothetical protein